MLLVLVDLLVVLVAALEVDLVVVFPTDDEVLARRSTC
jgi:hypothetical protein